MSLDDGRRLDAAIEAIVHGVYDSGALYDPHRWWPRSYLPYSPLFAEDFHSRWIGDFKTLEHGDVAHASRGTQLWVLLAMASRSLKTLMESSERVQFVLNLLNVIGQTEHGDSMCADGSHIVWSEDTVAATMPELDFFSTVDAPQVNKTFGQLNGNLLMYAEGIFFSANCTIRDVHGPYPLTYRGKQCQLLVRDYHRLRDTELEPATASFPYDAITTYSIYRPTVRFSFTVLNDYSSDLSLPQNALSHAAVVRSDGESRSLATVDLIEEARDVLADTVAQVTSNIGDLDDQQTANEIIRRVYYRAAPIAMATGTSWAPSSEFMDSFVKAMETFAPAMPPQMTRSDFAAMVDPRS